MILGVSAGDSPKGEKKVARKGASEGVLGRGRRWPSVGNGAPAKARLPVDGGYSLYPRRRYRGPQGDKEAGDKSKRKAK